jgi:hypothetical protein
MNRSHHNCCSSSREDGANCYVPWCSCWCHATTSVVATAVNEFACLALGAGQALEPHLVGDDWRSIFAQPDREECE